MSIVKNDGRKRVIITNITPQVDDGRYPAKAVLYDQIQITADIFTDGHDEVAASVLVRGPKDKQWTEIPLALVNNDHWVTTFPADKLGCYQFKVQAWVDHFTTWQHDLSKKYEANQEIRVELQIGAEIMKRSLANAGKEDKAVLEEWIEELNDPEDDATAISLALSSYVTEVMKRNANRSLQTQYPQTFQIEIERTRAGYSTWYEIFPRSASEEPGKHGTFKDVKRLLPRIARMGFDVLYFPPIHPIGEKNRKGRNNALTANAHDPGSPWAIGNKKGGHKAIHPELGSMKDFQNLVAEAKKFDIEIAMDIAYQCAPDHPYVKEHPQWFKWRPDGTVQYAENPPKKYEDILPINFETEDWENLWLELKSIIDFWIGKGVTIFRIDNPHTKAFPFWEWMIGEVRKKNPEVIFLAEAFTRPRLMEQLARAGFNQSYSYFAWRNTRDELREYMTELTQTNLRNYFRPNFWPNTPDILTPYLVNGGENAHIIRVLLAATLSSNYGIYGPVYEFGINTPRAGKEEYVDNEKYEIRHWDWNHETKISEIITRVNRIRRENPALQTTWNIAFAETTNDQIICFTKADEKSGNYLIIAVNLDPYNRQSAKVKIPVLELGMGYDQNYDVHDLLSGDRYHWHGDWNYVSLDPNDMPAHILRIENK